MGVEFTGAPEHERRAKIEDLIGRLSSQREVPKIFVGRKEARKDGEKEVLSAPDPASDREADADAPDPLLQLIRGGASLDVEQFLNDLRAQRLGNRRDPRIELALPVLLSGTDVSGRPLNQRVMTINISRRGALLDGVHGVLQQGDIISLARLQKKEQFRVAWVGAEGSPAAGQIGVAAVDPNSSFWAGLLDATAQSGLEAASVRGEGGTSPRGE
jgi:hypothetical protein